ncbi:hypothetical protein [Sphingomonas sp. So64.6b]|uniref:hypothetical protein n=1 Tax=Sphingomonas sp. So64.6b TaxID=2997354 RepID=UPI001603792F|nr:hypothetical protein [Sphingomonas sp. So64.6b]
MDLNYLLSREQISLMRADVAACESSRASHTGLARGYAALLDAEPYPFRNSVGPLAD